jgi:superfamily II DNA/RNA helicase
VYRDIITLSQFISQPKLKSMVLVGGVDSKKQQKLLKSGIDIIICTPQKAIELVTSGILNVTRVKYFILDEADALVSDGGSLHAIHALYNACPTSGTGDNRLQV